MLILKKMKIIMIIIKLLHFLIRMDQNIISIEGLFEVTDNSYISQILYLRHFDENKESYVRTENKYTYYFYNTPLKYVLMYLDGILLARHLYQNIDVPNFEEEFGDRINELKEIKKQFSYFRSFNKNKTKRRYY